MCKAAGLIAGLVLSVCAAAHAQVDYVIHISVDGLRPDAITNLLVAGTSNLPGFWRLMSGGVSTTNARCDYDISVTLPNHTTQLTGRGVYDSNGREGHGWTDNSTLYQTQTIASNNGGVYVPGVFDVAHDNGLRTGEYASKDKFALFGSSWGPTTGAFDLTGTDNGRNKIDSFHINSNTTSLVGGLVTDMQASPMNYVFLHLTDLDTVGHSKGWDPAISSSYSKTLKNVIDPELESLFDMIDGDSRLRDHTAIILTADHGGSGTDHSNAALAADYTIPFMVWGPGVSSGADLYDLNDGLRLDPGTGRPTYLADLQPIRNGEAANLALDLLGLPAINGSWINGDQSLVVPEPSSLALLAAGALALARRRLSFRKARKR